MKVYPINPLVALRRFVALRSAGRRSFALEPDALNGPLARSVTGAGAESGAEPVPPSAAGEAPEAHHCCKQACGG